MADRYPTIDINNIRDDVPGTIISGDCKAIPVAYLQRRENCNRLENTALTLKILSCTVGGSNAQAKVNSVSPFNPKRAKTFYSANRSYNRYFLCADLNAPPSCCTIMTKSPQESGELLRFLHGEVFIGADFYLHEPNLTFQTIGNSLPVLSLCKMQLIPMKDTSGIGQAAPVTLPKTVGDTSYFILEGQSVDLHRMHVPYDVSCSGIQCDRQKAKGKCACIHNGPGQALVYSFDVEFAIPPSVGMGDHYTCQGFRSYRTTSLFFGNLEAHANETQMDEEIAQEAVRRLSMKAMVKHVNENGGWKIVGWCKKGEVSDAANENDKQENNEVLFHLTYLFPIDAGILQSEAFKKLQISTTPATVSREL